MELFYLGRLVLFLQLKMVLWPVALVLRLFASPQWNPQNRDQPKKQAGQQGQGISPHSLILISVGSRLLSYTV
jgi:hypothetical protein